MQDQDNPPPLPYRCGTMLRGMTAEQRQKALKSIRDQEQAYINWVRAHPAPLQKWLDTATRLEQRQALEALAAAPESLLGRALRGTAQAASGKPTADVILLDGGE